MNNINNQTFYTNVVQKSSKILLRGFENGRRISRKIDYSPYLFLGAPNKKTKFHTLQGEPVDKIQFDSSYEMYQFTKKYENTAGFKYYGLASPVYTFINDNYPQGLKYDQSLISIVNLDIEVGTSTGYPTVLDAANPITNIVLRKNGKNLALGLKDYEVYDANETEYIKCSSEEELLKVFLGTWNTPEWMPDIVTGWNILIFDIPYLVRRIWRVINRKTADMLSPWNSTYERKIESKFYRQEIVYDIHGI